MSGGGVLLDISLVTSVAAGVALIMVIVLKRHKWWPVVFVLILIGLGANIINTILELAGGQTGAMPYLILAGNIPVAILVLLAMTRKWQGDGGSGGDGRGGPDDGPNPVPPHPDGNAVAANTGTEMARAQDILAPIIVDRDR